MNKNNCFANTKPCSGCGACYAICPVGAIAYRLSNFGFYEAFLDREKCVSCGKCVQVCPKYVQHENQIDKNTFSVYSFVHQNAQALMESSSGAASSALAGLAQKEGYRIAGVEYNYADNMAQASLANTAQDVEKFKGSKYLQASTRIYKDLLQLPGKWLVFGTPCQLIGLALAAEQKSRRDDFLLVDCFCHGVPSYEVWHKFLDYIDIAHPQDVSFRSKKGGWHNFYMHIKGKEKIYQADVRTNPFYQLFFSDLLLNDACYTCRAKSSKFSDIRLGDFWGANYDLTEKGVSLVLPLSDRGRVWMEKLATMGTLKDIGNLRAKIVKSQSAFVQTKCNVSERGKLLTAFVDESFGQAFALYKTGLSGKKILAMKFKAVLPLWLSKYMRFLAHKAKGY